MNSSEHSFPESVKADSIFWSGREGESPAQTVLHATHFAAISGGIQTRTQNLDKDFGKH